MENTYTKYVVQGREKSFGDAVWHDWYRSAGEYSDTLEEALSAFDKHFAAQARTFEFRLVKREYTTKESVVKV